MAFATVDSETQYGRGYCVVEPSVSCTIRDVSFTQTTPMLVDAEIDLNCPEIVSTTQHYTHFYKNVGSDPKYLFAHTYELFIPSLDLFLCLLLHLLPVFTNKNKKTNKKRHGCTTKLGKCDNLCQKFTNEG